MSAHSPLARVATAAIVFALAAGAARAFPPTAHEIAALDRPGGLRLSPDGERLIYLLTTHDYDPAASYDPADDLAGWTSDRQLWLAFTDGREPRQLTFGEKVSHPRWSPDGERIAFLRDGQIHVLLLAGGEAEPVATGDLEPGAFAWSPDGARFAFLATPPLPTERKEEKWANGGVETYGEEWRNDVLYVVPASGGEPRAVYQGPKHVVDFTWSPDGRRFAVLLSESSDPYYTYSLRVPAIIDAETGQIVRELAGEPRGVDNLRWSPDGRYVAYATGIGTLSLMNTLRVHDLEAGVFHDATEGMDATIYGFVWRADGDCIYAHIVEKTRSALYRLCPAGTKREKLEYVDRVLSGTLTIDADARRLAALSSTPFDPHTPTVFDLKKERYSIPVNLNEHADRWPRGEVRIVSWTNPEGVEIEGLLMLPPDRDYGEPGVLMVVPHGGPDSVTMQSWSSWTRYFSSRGYAVLRPNYRGGLGYGFEFYAANRGRLGEIEFADIESGVDHLLAENVAHADSLVYGGWSWGGYITDWTIGHTDRYAAAVSGASVSDPVSGYALSDINRGVAAEWEYKGNPWFETGQFDESAPWRWFSEVSTPTLVLHGENDRRVPLAQSVILYRALRDAGVPVTFYVYPREPHGPREPAHVEHYLTVWAQWYDRWLTESE